MRILDSFCGCFRRRTQHYVLVFGARRAGATTLVRRALLPNPTDPLPPALPFAFSIESVPFPVEDTSLLVAGAIVNSRVRPVWRNYFPLCDAVIFIVDATDRASLMAAAAELRAVSGEPGLAGKPLLLLLNKCDADDALSTVELFHNLELNRYDTWGSNRPWFVQRASTATGDGVGEALDWVRREVVMARGINRHQCATFGGLQALFRPRSLFAECH